MSEVVPREVVPGLAQARAMLGNIDSGKIVVGGVSALVIIGALYVTFAEKLAGDQVQLNSQQVAANLVRVGNVALTKPPAPVAATPAPVPAAASQPAPVTAPATPPAPVTAPPAAAPVAVPPSASHAPAATPAIPAAPVVAEQPHAVPMRIEQPGMAHFAPLPPAAVRKDRQASDSR